MNRYALLLAAALAPLAVHAAYPDRPVKMIVPWPAGGDTDNIFRPFAPLLQKTIGQPVVIANVAGASGTKGAKEAKDSPADGYTVYAVHDYIHSTYYTGVADVQYTDFEPICLISSTASVLGTPLRQSDGGASPSAMRTACGSCCRGERWRTPRASSPRGAHGSAKMK